MAPNAARGTETNGGSMPDESGRSRLHWRTWALVGCGAIVGGGSAVEYFAQGDYVKAVIGGLVCATCLGVVAWALRGGT